MTKREKQRLVDFITNFLRPQGISFRFADQFDRRGIDGHADTGRREIVYRADGSATVAHEIAHIVQHDLRGATLCSSVRGRTVADFDLQDEHRDLTRAWYARMLREGVAQEFDRAVGISYGCMEVLGERFRGTYN